MLSCHHSRCFFTRLRTSASESMPSAASSANFPFDAAGLGAGEVATPRAVCTTGDAPAAVLAAGAAEGGTTGERGCGACVAGRMLLPLITGICCCSAVAVTAAATSGVAV